MIPPVYDAPGSVAQRFLESNARRRVIMGPFGSGKSVACCVEIMRRSREQAPSDDNVRRTRWAVVRNTYPDLKNTTVKTWRDWWGDEFGAFSRVAPFVHHMKFPLVDGTRVDCEVIFLALDDEADAKKFLSLELTGIYFNELREMKRGIVEAGDGRLGRYPSMKDGGPTWYGMIADATISWTNYATGNTGAAARLKLTGTPAAACTLTFPAYHNFLSVENTTAQTITIKCAGGTGVAIPAGQKVLIYCDGVDYHNAAATIGPTQTQNTNTYAFAQWGAVQTAIATASLPATAGTLLNSGSDTTAGYLSQKLTLSFTSATTTQLSGLLSATLSTENAGANEKLKLTLSPPYVAGYLDGGRNAAPVTVGGGYAYALTSGCTFYLESSPSDQAKARIALFSPSAMYTIDPNGKKINNSTSALTLPGGTTFEITFDATLGDWE